MLEVTLEEGMAKLPTENETVKAISLRNRVVRTFRQYKHIFGYILLCVFLLCYTIYLTAAFMYNFYNSIALLVFTVIGLFIILYYLLKRKFGHIIFTNFDKYRRKILDFRHIDAVKWFMSAVFAIAFILYLVLVVIQSVQQIQSLSGMVVFLLVPYVLSKHPEKVNWRPVVSGVIVQFIVGILVLRWKPGFDAMNFIATEINKFLSYSIEGAAAVFGDPMFILHPLAFIVLSLIVYIGAVTAILYHFGLVQLFATKVGWVMRTLLGITAIEATSLTTNIFLSVLDVIIMLRAYLPHLTKSEFHTFMVGSHSTIAGFAFALFVLFGVSPQHLLTGALISVPAAVVLSKLNWPETEKSCFETEDSLNLGDEKATNFIEAAANGASVAAKGVMSIFLQIIAFISLYVFINATLKWIGQRVDIELSLEIIFSYLFLPLAVLMGIEWKDAQVVARLLGIKIVANEVLAFYDLGEALRQGSISRRSAAIATYSICGFSSFGTLAIFVGVWQSIDPKKTAEVSNQIPRIMMNANFSCFLTACVAGILFTEDVDQPVKNPGLGIVGDIIDLIPGYEQILNALPRF